ncbi:MAG: ParB/RepB/Spo0J family partition protein, partial [Lachnospiraceae bacterium]|nr:ParB/RepB/Spo0J family partition protein [Lachnospiraceae bacterium]
MPEKEIIIEIAIERLRDFPGSPFRVTMDVSMSDLIESIQTYGILTPLIVRPIPEGCYQIISGHRRRFAAAKLGYRKVPVIIRVMNDDEALVAMVDSNLQREKIRISEKAFAYRMKYDVVKREGKHPKEYFYGEKYRGMKTIEFMGKEQKDSPKQVQRMLNVTRLIPDLLRKLDEGKFGFTPAAELALLCKEEQFLLNDAMEYTQTAPTLSQAIRIKHIAGREDLTMDKLVRILNENNKKVLKRVVFADESIYQFFSPEESPQEIKKEILRM